MAGSAAGGAEHFTMFPIDTLKTRLQAKGSVYTSVFDTAKKIVSQEGAKRLYRGVSAVLLTAIPSHGLYFGVYEAAKEFLLGDKNPAEYPLYTAVAGALGTMAHDAIVTPLDVVKQRMQTCTNCRFTIVQCTTEIYQQHGFRLFYRSYPTTVALNIPFQCSHFVVYETVKHMLATRSVRHDDARQHMLAGACAGAVGGFISTPLDVVKTRIQLSQSSQKGMMGVLRELIHKEGFRNGLFKGVSARTLYFIPSATITWTVYEAMKTRLGFDLSDVEDLLE